jgi:enhancing lycopene biosynthesis protein 2
LGKSEQPQQSVKEMENGSVAITKEVTECHIDRNNKLVTTPAYMEQAAIHEVILSIVYISENIISL